MSGTTRRTEPGGRHTTVALLDLGGVLVDVDKSWAAAAWTAATGRPGSDFDLVFLESGVKDRMDVGDLTASAALAIAAELAGQGIGPSLVRDCYVRMLRARPQVADLVLRLSRRLRIGVVSNTDPIHAAWIEEHSGVFGVVEEWTYSFEERLMKPDPGLILAAVRAMAVDPAEVLLIDDRADNCAAARGVGLDTIRFEHLEQVAAELRQRGLLDL